MNEEDRNTEEETIITTASYRGFMIFSTSRNRILVKIYTETYPVAGLNEAKKMIDDTITEKVN